MNIIKKPCPNYIVGRNNHKPEIIVIHVMDGTLTGTDAWFANKDSQVSAHYGVGVKGEIHQYVNEADQAWHAGRVVSPTFKLYKGDGLNPNLYTIGIEHEGKADSIWTTEQKVASADLIKDICTRYNIPIDRDHIIGHYQVYAAKPNCPGINKDIIDELVKLASVKVPDFSFGEKFAGKLLLAVEDHGSIWYVTPQGTRAKIGRTPEEVSAFLSAINAKLVPVTGINNADIDKIQKV